MDYSISFSSPNYLWLLLLLPVLWYLGRGSLRGLSRPRATMALLLRSVVAGCIVLALAEIEFVRQHKQTTVLFLIDRSLSIPEPASAASLDYVQQAIEQQLDRTRADRAGVIAFGREASIELPPFADYIPQAIRVETPLDREQTDLAKALRMAAATFPENGARRVVILSDGNETLGAAREEAQRLVSAGVGIDVLPISTAPIPDVAIERVSVPSNIRQGEPFDVRVTLQGSDVPADAPVSGALRLSRTFAGQTDILSDQSVQLGAGRQVFTIREQIDVPDFYTYEAQFVADDVGRDRFRQNNRAATAAHIRGRGRVLVIEDSSAAGQSDHWVASLRKSDFEVEVRPVSTAFNTLADLQRFDSVILNDVPRVSGDQADALAELSDRQVHALVQNTRELGAGLIMLGGPNSFGAGGWANTELEEAMPVDFHIKSLKVVPSGALMLVIDRSGSMADGKLAMAKNAAIEALRVLGPQDYIGVVTFDSVAEWAVPMQSARQKERIASRVARIGVGGGTNLWPGMVEGSGALRRAPAAVKHMIILTDGQTEGSGYVKLAREMRNQRMTVTCVGVGDDADNHLLSQVAMAGGGKFYHVRRPTSIPRIFMKEAMRVARPLIFEDPSGFTAQLRTSHEILSGSEETLPPLTGYVMTTPKQNPLVEVSLLATKPSGANNPLLATWTYGLGRTAVWTSDVGQRWASQWPAWPGYDRFFAQLVRWSLRPADDSRQFNLVTHVDGDRVQVVVSALDDQNFLNFLNMSASVVDPTLGSNAFELRQTAPGCYTGEFPIDSSGNYFINILPGASGAPLRAAVNIPYSDEFANREPNKPLLHELAQLTPDKGLPGAVIESPDGLANVDELLQVNVFRGGLRWATSQRGAWHLLLLCASVLFLGDIANRRLQLDLQGALAKLSARFTRRAEVAVAPTMDRLRAAKTDVAQRYQSMQADLPSDTAASLIAESQASAATPLTRPEPQPQIEPSAEGSSYTSRLLKAKRDVWSDREQE